MYMDSFSTKVQSHYFSPFKVFNISKPVFCSNTLLNQAPAWMCFAWMSVLSAESTDLSRESPTGINCRLQNALPTSNRTGGRERQEWKGQLAVWEAQHQNQLLQNCIMTQNLLGLWHVECKQGSVGGFHGKLMHLLSLHVLVRGVASRS